MHSLAQGILVYFEGEGAIFLRREAYSPSGLRFSARVQPAACFAAR